jgi:hypothetical protein
MVSFPHQTKNERLSHLKFNLLTHFFFLSLANADSPRFRKGNKILIGIAVATAVLIVFQHVRYVITNKLRQRKWDAMSADEKLAYKETTGQQGSNRLDYQFRI